MTPEADLRSEITINQKHFNAYLRAGMLFPISNFALNATHLHQILSHSNPAAYFQTFFTSTLAPEQIKQLARAMNAAHSRAGVQIFSLAAHNSSTGPDTHFIDAQRHQHQWDYSKAHTVRSLLSAARSTRVSLPDEPTELLTREHAHEIAEYLSHEDPDKLDQMNTQAAIALQALANDRAIGNMKAIYISALPEDRDIKKQAIKAEIARNLADHMPNTDFQWLFKIDPEIV